MVSNVRASLIHASKNRDEVENIKILNHRLSNILGFSETSMNRLRNADRDVVDKRWGTMRDVIMVTGRNRISKEIGLYRKERKKIEKISGEIYNGIYKRFLESDKYYKVMFDLLNRSEGYNIKDKKAVLASGDKLIRLLKDIVNKLETIRIESQKI